MAIVSAIVLLFLVMDPFGNIPLFLPALAHIDPKRRTRVVVRELLIALGALVLFLFGGHFLLQVLQISDPALTIAGGIILFLIAIKMIFPAAGNSQEERVTGEPFIVPLAIPYVAGPSALSAVLLLSSGQPSAWAQWLLAIVVAWFASSIILLGSSAMSRYLGDRVLIAIERLMGMLLITVAVQMAATGITHFLTLPR